MQITDLVPPTALFSEYLYFSSFSDAILKHSREASLRHIEQFALDSKSLVVEIASNDGYLLKNFTAAGIPCFGIEPAANIAKVAREKGIESIVEFFGKDLAERLVAQGRQADLIIGNNVFAHAPEINDFVSGLKVMLKPKGRIVLEFPFGVELIEHTEFDTIYHEHVFYFTLTPLLPLFERHGLSIFRVERIPIHGGSLRLFVSHEGAFPVESSVTELAAREDSLGVSSLEYYESFASRVASVKKELLALLDRLKSEGKSIAAYGASAKGSTFLNFFGIGKETIAFVVDRSTYKQGLITPGTHISILPAEELAARRPDYTLLLTWNFADEILAQQESYRKQGGKFIIAVPEVRVV